MYVRESLVSGIGKPSQCGVSRERERCVRYTLLIVLARLGHSPRTTTDTLSWWIRCTVQWCENYTTYYNKLDNLMK